MNENKIQEADSTAHYTGVNAKAGSISRSFGQQRFIVPTSQQIALLFPHLFSRTNFFPMGQSLVPLQSGGFPCHVQRWLAPRKPRTSLTDSKNRIIIPIKYFVCILKDRASTEKPVLW